MIESEFMIIEPKPSLLKRVMVSATYTAFIAYALYLYKEKISVQGVDSVVVIICLAWVFGGVLLFTIGGISRHGIQFNFKEMKIRHIYDISGYRYKEKWQNLNELEYISVFKVDARYQLNMWYETNNILNLCVLDDYNEAINYGYQIASKLQIDLLDASIKGDNKWIDKETFKKTGQIEFVD